MRLPVALTLCGSLLFGQSVSTRSGSILYADSNGEERRITQGFDDRDPSLSTNGRFVVFVRVTKAAPNPTRPMETQVLESELWLADTSGSTQPTAIFRGSVITPDHRSLTAFFAPQFSPGGEYVYFLAQFAATSHALCRLDVLHHRASFLSGGAIEFAVLTTGVHRGQIIASIRTAPDNPDNGYSYPYYLLNSDGRRVRRISNESADIKALVTRYSTTPWQ